MDGTGGEWLEEKQRESYQINLMEPFSCVTLQMTAICWVWVSGHMEELFTQELSTQMDASVSMPIQKLNSTVVLENW